MHMEKNESECTELEFCLFCRDSVMYQIQASLWFKCMKLKLQNLTKTCLWIVSIYPPWNSDSFTKRSTCNLVKHICCISSQVSSVFQTGRLLLLRVCPDDVEQGKSLDVDPLCVLHIRHGLPNPLPVTGNLDCRDHCREPWGKQNKRPLE